MNNNNKVEDRKYYYLQSRSKFKHSRYTRQRKDDLLFPHVPTHAQVRNNLNYHKLNCTKFLIRGGFVSLSTHH